ncbi:MAG: hypothetical protein U0529_14320 [Thermoanaerobaculia bacterium]
MTDDALLAAFVAAFGRHDDMLAVIPALSPHAHALRLGKPGRYGERWRPKRVRLGHRALDSLYRRVPARLPSLYERLITSYRWAEVEVGPCALLANPPGPGLTGLLAQFFRDPGLTDVLHPRGYIPFARGAGGNYDPVCFATQRGVAGNDAPVVQLDHEEVLCSGRIRVVSELAPSFRALVHASLAITSAA